MEFNPTRLQTARKRQGLTITALSSSTRLSTKSLSSYENGHSAPTEETVSTLALALRIAPSFLVGTDLDEVPEGAVSFRALSKMTARQRDRGLAAGRIAILINDWIQSRFALPASDLPTLTGRAPEAAAQELRARWGLASASATGPSGCACSACRIKCPSSCAASNRPRSPDLVVLRNTNGWPRHDVQKASRLWLSWVSE